MGTWLPSAFVTATLLASLAGCSASSGKTGDTGPTYCAQRVGAVGSCESTATTGTVVQCGPQFPVCAPPGQSGVGVWACCATTILGDGVQETSCGLGASGEASCPCVGCDDAGP
jgi:hypothetical protein